MATRALRLDLLCAGATRLTRAGAFPHPDEPLDAGWRAKAAAVRLAGTRCWTGPACAARETADLLGIAAAVAPALADRSAGDWAGRGLAELPPGPLAAWFADPAAAPPGGEGLAGVAARAGAWLDGLAAGPALAITHPDTVRGLLVHALGLPPAATLAIDLAPLTLVRLSHAGRWRLTELRAG